MAEHRDCYTIAREMLGLSKDTALASELHYMLTLARTRTETAGGRFLSRQAIAVIVSIWEFSHPVPPVQMSGFSDNEIQKDIQKVLDMGKRLSEKLDKAKAECQMTVYDEVKAERARQDEKWGQQNHHPAEWLSILGEEFGEVCKAVCEAHFDGYESTWDWKNYREELIQTVAVGISMIECLDRNGPPRVKDYE